MNVATLRHMALTRSLGAPVTLAEAVDRLGFVQADPIQSPARAQDLILRHRVLDYRAGDLEQHYPALGLEEDVFYAYGFMPASTWRLLHPRKLGALTAREKRVLDFARSQDILHPRDLDAAFGRRRERNPWGGMSQATTQTLQSLHHRGLLRVAGRDNGIRLYSVIQNTHEHASPEDRLREVILMAARIFAPVQESSLRSISGYVARHMPKREKRLAILKSLLKEGVLVSETVDGVRYLWPAGDAPSHPHDDVKFLAPFDPIVWSRPRFEHLFGWSYRFEAYTPEPKRLYGYYALPLLWRDRIIGWVNASRAGSLTAGFLNAKPRDPSFRRAFDDEAARLRRFLWLQ